MATISGSTNNSNWTYKLEASESNVNISNNTSVVTVTAYIGRASSRSYLGGTWSGSITVNGSSQNMSGTISYPTYVNGGEWISLATKRFTVTHGNDGSKNVGISSSFSSGDFTPSWASASGSMWLTTIPRASTITCTSANIEETAQITVSRKSNNFTHVIAYSITGSGGTESNYILEDGSTTSTRTKISATSIGFPLPSRWYALIPDESEVTVNLSIDTYNGDNQIGSTQKSTFVASVNAATNKPNFEASVVDINEETIALTGDNKTLVLGYSTASVSWSASAKNYATINFVKINGTITEENPYNFTFTDIPLIAMAVDSRLGTTLINLSKRAIVKEYFAPDITISGYREEPTSSYMNIKFQGNFWNDNFGATDNVLTLSWKYRKYGENEWTDGGTFIKDTDYKINGNAFYSGNGNQVGEIQIGGTMVYESAWDIGIFVNDKLYTMPVQIISVTKGIPIANWGEEYFNVNGELRIYNKPIPQTAVSNVRSDSDTETYSCEYINSVSGGSGTTNYNALINLPTINGVTLTGDKTSSQLGINVPTKTSQLTNDSRYVDVNYHDSTKQDVLVSGTSIKTINNQSILGSGNINIIGGAGCIYWNIEESIVEWS